MMNLNANLTIMVSRDDEQSKSNPDVDDSYLLTAESCIASGGGVAVNMVNGKQVLTEDTVSIAKILKN